jgi:hypothetical protein
LDERVAPALVQPINFSVTNYAKAVADGTTDSDQKGHNETATAGGSGGADAKASSDDFGDGTYAAVTYDIEAHSVDYGMGYSTSAFAFSNGSFDLQTIAEAADGEVNGDQMVVRAYTFEYHSFGNVSFTHSVNGHKDFNGAYYYLTAIGATVPVSFNLTASVSAPAGSNASDDAGIRRQIQFDPAAYAIKVLSGSDITGYEEESLRMSGPSMQWTDFDENFTYRYDLNNDGVWDYEGPDQRPTFTWQQLFDLGLTASSTPYTYRVQVEQPLTSFGIAGSWSDEATGQITILPPRYSSHMSVSSTFDLDPSPMVFGPYLPGVALTVPFTITVDRSVAPPSHVGYSIDNGPIVQATKVSPTDPYVWKASFNPGSYNIAKTGLKSIAFAAIKLKPGYQYDVLGYYNAKLNITGTRPDFELTAAAAGGAGPVVNAEQTRFISGISADIRLTGQFSNVPKYYHNLLSVVSGLPIHRNAQTIDDYTARIEFVRDVKNLWIGLNKVNANIGNRNLTYFGDAVEQLFAIRKPNWFTGGTANFDQTDGAYRFINSTVSLYSSRGPTVNPPRLAWLNALTSGKFSAQRLTAFLNLNTSIDGNAPIDFDQSALWVQAKVLGTPVWDHVYGGGDLNFSGAIDSWTFNPVGFGLSLAAPADLGSRSLLGRPAKLPVAVSAAPYGNLVLSLLFDSTLTAAITGIAGLKLNWSNNRVNWVSDGTFFSLSGSGTTMPAVSVSVVAPFGWLTQITSSGAIRLDFDIGGITKFGGSSSFPVIASSTYRGLLDGAFNFLINGVRRNGSAFEYDSLIEDPGDGRIDNRFDDVVLFKI